MESSVGWQTSHLYWDPKGCARLVLLNIITELQIKSQTDIVDLLCCIIPEFFTLPATAFFTKLLSKLDGEAGALLRLVYGLTCRRRGVA